jgi:uncharacterized protein with GYD domain
MSSYLILLNFTEQGIRSIKDNPSQLEAIKQVFQAQDMRLKSFHLLISRYDAVIILEANNEESVASAVLKIASTGNVRTETFRAFTEDEYLQIINKLR